MKNKPKNILITGMTALQLGAMEKDNLGNFVIIEPFFKSLRDEFKESKIYTTLQLSDQFCKRYNIKTIKDELYWRYNLKNLFLLLLEYCSATIINILKKVGVKKNLIFSKRLNILNKADIIIDFHGDLFGDNALNWEHFLTGILIPIISKKLKKPIFLIASSPGSFKSLFKLISAKIALKKYDLVAVREPISEFILNGIGLYGKKYIMYPCFSYGFKPIPEKVQEFNVIEQEPLLKDKKIVGLILSNLNMNELPLNKWPRRKEEFQSFIELISFLVSELDVKVCIFSHRNKLDSDGRHILGSDHCIIDEIIKMLPDDISKGVFTLNHIYEPSEMNRIISNFDMLISGRIHGAIQAISQYIPTVIIDYGKNNNAHKLKGFAISLGLLDYVCDPEDSHDMISKSKNMWKNKEKIIHHLEKRVPELVEQSKEVWKEIQNIYLNKY